MRLGLIFGGKSGEHEVSVRSGHAVWKASVKAGFDVVGIGITRAGEFLYLGDCVDFFGTDPQEVRPCEEPARFPKCFILPDPTRPGIYLEDSTAFRIQVDAIFPVLHGSYGEDGAIQGLLELSGIPYVGAPVLGSAVCMDKDTTKRLLATHGVPHVPALTVERFEWQSERQDTLSYLCRAATFPAFVKPSGSGSSLGVTKVKTPDGLADALDVAFLYDTKALVEPSQEDLMEIECAVLGNAEPRASVPGQILPRREFYDYDAKYVEDTTDLIIPAPLDPDTTKEVQQVAVQAFRATGCRGMARVDFFVGPMKGEVYVNELNTIPGFTSISMYPKMWEASGLHFHELVKSLVDLAIEQKRAAWKEVIVRR
ncbi:MAG: D-alanine--D-alanine ligase family protein [Bacillota bacterium]